MVLVPEENTAGMAASQYNNRTNLFCSGKELLKSGKIISSLKYSILLPSQQ